jgi:hypothetical protein
MASLKSPAQHTCGALDQYAFTLAYTEARESSDNPMLKAFCRVAPSVRFKVLAMRVARVFFFAKVFNTRISAVVHSRRFAFLTI